jgi:PIN domain nuclease of toxin-antitoxin system
LNYLLDTHTFLWAIGGNPEIPAEVTRLLEHPSLWEIAIKLSLRMPFSQLVEHAEAADITLLPIAPTHLAALVELPFHHRDPFDRLLLAQCEVESLSLISRDTALSAYGVAIIWRD